MLFHMLLLFHISLSMIYASTRSMSPNSLACSGTDRVSPSPPPPRVRALKRKTFWIDTSFHVHLKLELGRSRLYSPLGFSGTHPFHIKSWYQYHTYASSECQPVRASSFSGLFNLSWCIMCYFLNLISIVWKFLLPSFVWKNKCFQFNSIQKKNTLILRPLLGGLVRIVEFPTKTRATNRKLSREGENKTVVV